MTQNSLISTIASTGLTVAWLVPFVSPGRLQTEFSFNYLDAGLFYDQHQSIIPSESRRREEQSLLTLIAAPHQSLGNCFEN